MNRVARKEIGYWRRGWGWGGGIGREGEKGWRGEENRGRQKPQLMLMMLTVPHAYEGDTFEKTASNHRICKTCKRHDIYSIFMYFHVFAATQRP